jgi:hypothetical protein
MSELAIAANGNGIGRAANANSSANGLAAGENPVVNAWKRYEGLKNVDDAKNQLIEVCSFFIFPIHHRTLRHGLVLCAWTSLNMFNGSDKLEPEA